MKKSYTKPEFEKLALTAAEQILLASFDEKGNAGDENLDEDIEL